MITRIDATAHDRDELAQIPGHLAPSRDGLVDYSKVVMRKPWGYEYLIFQNDEVAVWILHLKAGAQTSMHCHLTKKTALVVLEHEVVCSTLQDTFRRGPGDGLMIATGAFHQTKATSGRGAFVMEVESPADKHDLIRRHDEYGRVGQGYETVDKHVFGHNYNYLTLNQSEVYHNVTKRFGPCTLTLKRLTTTREIAELRALHGDDVLSLLKGCLIDEEGRVVLDVGDTASVERLTTAKGLRIGGDALELLMVKTRDTVIKVSDYITTFLKSHDVRQVFFVPGDANVHLIDSLGRDEELSYLCHHTERVAAMAAEAYSKLTSKLGVLLISCGASGTNAVTGVADAWTDSTPLMVISGQATTDQLGDPDIRQFGNKSLNIVEMVRPITKYAVRVTDPTTIRYHLEKAAYLAAEGRPGPVWVDLPVDLQGLTIDERDLKAFEAPARRRHTAALSRQVAETVRLLRQSQRPVLLAGIGVRLAGAEGVLQEVVDRMAVPMLTSRRGADLIAEDHPLFFGRPGAYGQRRANFVIQNADVLLSVGARLSIPQVGRNYKAFARCAKKVLVDIDRKELEKKTVKADLAIRADAKAFLDELLAQLAAAPLPSYEAWRGRCEAWRLNFPPSSSERYQHQQGVNPYLFVDVLSEALRDDDVLVVDGGQVMNYTMQTFRFRQGQRLISSIGVELPGFALPGAIGSCVGCGRQRVICLCEDLGFQLTLQELQTIVDHRLPIKIFVLKSAGHTNIRKIQQEYFGGRYVGTDHERLFGSPDLLKISEIYGCQTVQLRQPEELPQQIRAVLSSEGPAVCEVQVDQDQEIVPRIVLNMNTEGVWEAKPLEDMYPFLDRGLLKENMVIPLWEEAI